MRFCIVGDGAMATACALLLAERTHHHICVWSRFPRISDELATIRENTRYLPGISIPLSIEFVVRLPHETDVDVMIAAVPMLYLTETLTALREQWPSGKPIVSVIKGMEQETLRLPSEVFESIVGLAGGFCALTGPSHAEELARRMPASVVAASTDEGLSRAVAGWFSTDRFRVYTSTDLRGAELGGALKNCMAIAAGICDGLELGDNAKSALMTRGLVEINRLGVALGGREETFFGLAGLGDLLTTCMSRHSRNRAVGEAIGKGERLDSILARTQKVAEGIWTTKSMHQLAMERKLDAPIINTVHEILFGTLAPERAVDRLMSRDLKAE